MCTVYSLTEQLSKGEFQKSVQLCWTFSMYYGAINVTKFVVNSSCSSIQIALTYMYATYQGEIKAISSLSERQWVPVAMKHGIQSRSVVKMFVQMCAQYQLFPQCTLSEQTHRTSSCSQLATSCCCCSSSEILWLAYLLLCLRLSMCWANWFSPFTVTLQMLQ